VRVTVRAYPSSRRERVGGRYGSDEPATLIVRVTAPAVDGKANEAVLTAVSAALGVPRRNARIITGAESRTKVLELDGADPQQFAALVAHTEE
jgi:uncharacterized protein YggU (UPF0235/DUF167 family)